MTVTVNGAIPSALQKTEFQTAFDLPAATALADRSDPTKGAAQIGDKGTTLRNSLALNLRKPRKIFRKLHAAAIGPTNLRIMTVGDSLGYSKIQQLTGSLDRKMGGTMAAQANVDGSTDGAGDPPAGNDTYANTFNLAEYESNKYEFWPTGNLLRIDAGGSSEFVNGGYSPTFVTVDVFFIKEPGAGTITLEVEGVVVGTQSANAAVGLGIMSYTQPLEKKTIVVKATGGSVRVIFVHRSNPDVTGVNFYNSMHVGGMELSVATANPQCRAIWQAAITAIAPDLIPFEFDDNFADTNGSAAFDLFCGILDVAAPYADKLIIASLPRAVDDAGKYNSRDYLHHACGIRDASYLFFDAYSLMGSYAEMTAIFGADDGVHPNASAHAYVAEVMWDFLGLNSPSYGFTSRAVNDPGTPSRVAKGTVIQGPGGDRGADLSFETDSSFGYDWEIRFPRSIAMGARGGYGSTDQPLWVFSGNTSVIPHVVPMNFKFDSSDNTRSIGANYDSGYEFFQLQKSDNPGGGLMHLNTGLLRSSFTRAELLAMAANQLSGAMAFCSDCTGGAQWVFARGSSPTDWVTVDGKADI